MFHTGSIIRTKLAPPRQQKYTLNRPRLTQRLLDARYHRLAIVQAGTGYGKSTALSALAGEDYPSVWYRLDDEDADPQQFLLHLVHGFINALPTISNAPLVLLEAWDSARSTGWAAVVDALTNELARVLQEPAFLVLDDVHLLNDAPAPIRILDRLIGRAPQHLHVILSTRYPLQLPTMLTWRVKGEMLEITQDELAFTSTEIDQLFRKQYAYTLTLEQANLLVNQIEGWPIALHLIWQRLQRDGGASLPQALSQLSGSASDLFAYLTQEVFAQQAEDIQAFLRETAVLRSMTAANCDYIRSAQDSDQILRYLLEKGLFVVNLGVGHLRYHHLFREMLLNQLTENQRRKIHLSAADNYLAVNDEEEAIFHLLQAKAGDTAATIIDRLGRSMVRIGRLDTLAGWIAAISPDVLANHPILLIYLGDIDRLHSRFVQALNWYQQAEERSRLRADTRGLGRALRGQARVYLDTVNPARAEELLQEAVRLADGLEDRESRARLLELLAENLLNRGRTEEAQAYQAQARELRQLATNEEHLPVRMLLRTGRLNEGRLILEEQAALEEEAPVLRPRAHRETSLLLSLIYAFMGERADALETAVSGTERGQILDSQFIASVGFSRQGHALSLGKEKTAYDQARTRYHEAIALSKAIGVPRLQVEPFWGLCQIVGQQGDLQMAESFARQAIEIVQTDGDEWVEACVRVSMGSAFVLAGEYKKAADWLSQGLNSFQACSDRFGETVARLWQCIIWLKTEDTPRLERDIDDLLQRVKQHQYDFLFQRRTFFGPPDVRQLVPLLLFAREHNRQSSFAQQMLSQLGLVHIELHPGYQLRVQTLGVFKLWHGIEEVPARAWRRKKARQLFQLLITYRGTLLHRDQISALLWPDLDVDGAIRDFKIAFSAMCNVLEPHRKRNAPSSFVLRDGSRYGLHLDADCWLDIVAFETAVSAGDRLLLKSPDDAQSAYQEAFDLYQGDFLQTYPYEAWCSEERDRIQTRFLRSAERLAYLVADKGAWEQVIPLCNAILEIDDCWEAAYQLLIKAYEQLGNRTQAIRTYQRCKAALYAGLNVEPTAVTQQLYQSLV
jgi:LuxR family transcriptional regulator, maltose regulon positive regulatory protein